jgi:DNA-directed RNA polymerase beta' subunit
MMNILCAVQKQMSVAQIEHAETMEKGKPNAGGLSDPRMGTVDRKIKCQTCMTGMVEWPGQADVPHWLFFFFEKPTGGELPHLIYFKKEAALQNWSEQ